MRNWLFHPLLFYPLCLVLAAALIGLSLQPQKWPRPPAPVVGQMIEGALVLEGAAFDSPTPDPAQFFTVVRDLLGNPQALRIAVRPGLAPPLPTDTGVRLTLRDAAQAGPRGAIVEVRYNPLNVNAASALAVRLEGANPGPWQSRDIPPQAGAVRFTLPANGAVNAIGLRAVSNGTDQAYGVEIVRIRLIPQGG